jgi:hypothetical protein
MLWRAGSHRVMFNYNSRSLMDCLNESEPVNRIIYIVGLIVIVVFVLGYFGLR